MAEPKNELQMNAITTERRKAQETFQRALDIGWLDSRMADGGMSRCLSQIRREADMEKDFQERTDHAAIVNKRAEREIALGMEVAKVQREQTCELLRRHYLRERDPSLRELMQKLQAAYVCRDQRMQIMHNEYRRLQDKAEQHRANNILKDALYSDYDEKMKFEMEKMERTNQHCNVLKQQLVNRQRQKQCQYEDTLVEKKMLDDIMKTMYDEDMRELEQIRRLKEKTRREMVTFKQARDAWKEKQKLMVVEEERKIEEQAKAASDRSAAVIAERERKQREKEELNAKITAKILADEAERQQRSDIIKQLQEQEHLEKNANDDIATKEKLERVKKETKEALTGQMDIRKRLEKEQKERDLALRKETEAKIRAEDEKEREKERKLKEKNQRYCDELRRQIASNAVKRQKEKKSEDDRANNMWAFERKWDEEVSQERKKIIEEHAPRLLGYIQAAVLKKEDLPTIREGANKDPELAKLDIESLAVSNRPKRFAKCNEQCVRIRRF